MRTQRKLIFGACSLLFLGLTGCGKTFKLQVGEMRADSPWPFHHGHLHGRNEVPNGSFSGKLDVLWEQKPGGKAAGPMTIYHGMIVYPGSKDRLKFYDVSNGEYRGQLKARGTPQTGLTVRDSLAFFSTSPINNQLLALNLCRDSRLWAKSLRDAVNGTILYKENLIVGSRVGTVFALDPVSGEVIWRYEAEGLLNSAPVESDGRLYLATDDKHILAISADSGVELYRVPLISTVVAPVAAGALIIAGDVEGNVYGLDPVEGSVRWTTRLPGAIWDSPTVAEGRVFIGHAACEMVALDELSGKVLWRHETIEVVRASAVAVNGSIVFGTLGGKLISLRAGDGQLIEERQLEGAIAFGPVSDGQRVFVATQRGHLMAVGKNNVENISKADQ